MELRAVPSIEPWAEDTVMHHLTVNL